ncbi:MAG: GHKL domain-containing protein [Nitrospirae bacterium]|nr:GHKL domain-containing protein [Nitrospirota bacterium]
MSLKKKISLSFLISSIIIAILVISGYSNFIGIRKEVRYLEISDTVRSKSLQIRRHEKNFLLYGDAKEMQNVHTYINDLKEIIKQGRTVYSTEKLLELEKKIAEYEQGFNRIESTARDFQKELNRLKILLPHHSDLLYLSESTFLERPLVNAEIFKKTFSLKASAPAIKSLEDLNTEINELRKNGEEILMISKKLDKSARENVERYISFSQTAAIFLFPLFLFVGLGALFVIIHDVVRRLKILTMVVEKTGRRDFSSLITPSKGDEVGILINAFNKMERDLITRDNEINRKNNELLQNRKLASIGTLASGVAHELNNPLNNIYTTAQRLLKKTGEDCPAFIKKGLDDIFGQTMRVKKIVGDLLVFARGREPQFRETQLNSIIQQTYKQFSNTINTENIHFLIESEPGHIMINADTGQLEQVFINLFTNAVEAMSGKGELRVMAVLQDNTVMIRVSDSGRGVSRENLEKIFEPFFTTKDKGTGLGLAIVFSIIQKHNGEISVESEEGKGTTFIITLPKRNVIARSDNDEAISKSEIPRCARNDS